MAYYFKILTNEHTGGYSNYCWPQPGKSTPLLNGILIPCMRGYHVLRPRDIKEWIDNAPFWYGAEIYLVEVNTDGLLLADNKIVVRQAKVIRKMNFIKDVKWTNRASVSNWMGLNGIKMLTAAQARERKVN